MDSGKILTAVVTGLVAGVVVGLLFAPDKGSVTRQRLMDGAADISDKVKSAADDAYKKVADLGRKAQQTYQNAAEDQV